MAWRTVVITKNGRLSSRNKQLIWEDEEGKIELPLEDIAVLVLESHRVNLTVPVLSDLAQAGASVVVCNSAHQPDALMLPLHCHSRELEVVELQISSSQPFRKRCFQKVIKQKIFNQSEVLCRCGIPAGADLKRFIPKVLSGDRSNIEAIAAKEYWKMIFGKFFARSVKSHKI